MAVTFGLFGAANADYTIKSYPHFSGAVETNIDAIGPEKSNGRLHSNTKLGLSFTQPYFEQKLGHKFNLYDAGRFSWNVGLELYGKAEGNQSWELKQFFEEDHYICNHPKNYEVFGTHRYITRYAVQGGCGLEVVAKTPCKPWGRLKGSYVEFGAGIEGGLRYDGRESNEKYDHNNYNFDKVKGYYNPFAKVSVHLGDNHEKTPWFVGAEVSMQDASIKAGYVINLKR